MISLLVSTLTIIAYTPCLFPYFKKKKYRDAAKQLQFEEDLLLV
jgi:hypothetical protein